MKQTIQIRLTTDKSREELIKLLEDNGCTVSYVDIKNVSWEEVWEGFEQ